MMFRREITRGSTWQTWYLDEIFLFWHEGRIAVGQWRGDVVKKMIFLCDTQSHLRNAATLPYHIYPFP
jgi:hypothetical protein